MKYLSHFSAWFIFSVILISDETSHKSTTFTVSLSKVEIQILYLSFNVVLAYCPRICCVLMIKLPPNLQLIVHIVMNILDWTICVVYSYHVTCKNKTILTMAYCHYDVTSKENKALCFFIFFFIYK